MEERHENEQYFFDAGTISYLADFIQSYTMPCCLCTPTVGRELGVRGIDVRILDIDERFKDVPGFRLFDLTRPEWLGESFGIILFDPPFFNAVPVGHLFDVIRRLSNYDYGQKLLISWPTRRGKLLLEAFEQFGLEPTGYRPGYVSVLNEGKNEIEFYGNLGADEIKRLLSTSR
jgi:hypothetical protein